MSKSLLAAAVIAGILSFASGARAQWAVVDAPTEANTLATSESTQSISADTQNISRDSDQIQTNTQNTAQHTLDTYKTITTIPDVTQMFTNQDDSKVQNQMPDTSGIQSALNSKSPTLTQDGQTMYGQNPANTPGTDPILIAQDTVMKVSSNIQGMAIDNLNALAQRLKELSDMNDALKSAASITAVDAINGRIAVESLAVQAEQAQAANLNALAVAQAEINRENEAQAMRNEHTQTVQMFASAAAPAATSITGSSSNWTPDSP